MKKKFLWIILSILLFTMSCAEEPTLDFNGFIDDHTDLPETRGAIESTWFEWYNVKFMPSPRSQEIFPPWSAAAVNNFLDQNTFVDGKTESDTGTFSASGARMIENAGNGTTRSEQSANNKGGFLDKTYNYLDGLVKTSKIVASANLPVKFLMR